MSGRTYWELVEDSARQRPGATIASDERRRRLTLADLRDQGLEVAAAFHARGIGSSSVVAWQLPTTLEALLAIVALARLGATQVPLVPIYRRREVEFIVHQTGASLLVVPTEFRGFDHAGLAHAIADGTPELDVLVLTETGLPHAAGVEKLLPPPPNGPDEPRWVFYTSGTVADPKGARHSDATVIGSGAGYAERIGFTPDDRVGVTFPLSHIGGPTKLAAALHAGFALVLSEIFDPVATPEYFRSEGVTAVSGPALAHQAFLDAQRSQGTGRRFPSVRMFIGGGAPKPPGLSEALRTEVGAPLLSGYGATESPMATFCSIDDPPSVLDHTEGRASAGVDIRVVDAQGNDVRLGQEGELLLGGRQRSLGYVDPALSAEAFDDRGFFHTGDLGLLDERGNVVVTGRIKEIIIRKGENLSAREIQEALLRHPALADVAVVGVPDPRSGERACAVVVVRPGHQFDAAEMARHCRDEGLMNQKIPEQLEFVDEIPRNAMGKAMTAALRERYADPSPEPP